eukprot:gene23562-biopygen20828
MIRGFEKFGIIFLSPGHNSPQQERARAAEKKSRGGLGTPSAGVMGYVAVRALFGPGDTGMGGMGNGGHRTGSVGARGDRWKGVMAARTAHAHSRHSVGAQRGLPRRRRGDEARM